MEPTYAFSRKLAGLISNTVKSSTFPPITEHFPTTTKTFLKHTDCLNLTSQCLSQQLYQRGRKSGALTRLQ